MGLMSVDILGVGAKAPLLVLYRRAPDGPILIYKYGQKNKLENVAIAGHCNLRPPGLPPDPPAHPRGKVACPKTALGPV